MKYFAVITLALVGAVVSMPQMGGNTATSPVGGIAATSPIGGAAPAPGPQWGNTKDWGAKAYGQGLNNPWAVPVNPTSMQFMLNIANTLPGTLVRVDPDGEIELTDQFGQEIDFDHLGF